MNSYQILQLNPTRLILVFPFPYVVTPFSECKLPPSSVSLFYLFVQSSYVTCPCPFAHVLHTATLIPTPPTGLPPLLSLPVCALSTPSFSDTLCQGTSSADDLPPLGSENPPWAVLLPLCGCLLTLFSLSYIIPLSLTVQGCSEF